MLHNPFRLIILIAIILTSRAHIAFVKESEWNETFFEYLINPVDYSETISPVI